MTVELRDVPIQIEIADSCNCFNWCCKNETPVYITHDWKAEPFDFKKSVNLEKDKAKTIERIKELFRMLDESFYSIKNFAIETDDGWITFHHVKNINKHLKLFDV